jgi:conjugal transfer/type IV secretion protein DotA/TraY
MRANSQQPRSIGARILSGLGFVSGVGPAVSAVQGAVQTHADNFNWIGGMFRSAFGTQVPPDFAPGVSDPGARFTLAARKHGVHAEKLLAMQAAKWRFFATYFLLTVASVIAGALNFRNVEAFYGGSPALGALFAFSFVPACLALTARAAFEHWQLRTRRLDSFTAWLGRPGEWWPLSHATVATPRTLRGLAWLAIGAGSLALMSGSAYAQAAAAGPNDLDTSFRSDLPGQVLTLLAGGQGGIGTPWTHGLAMFSSWLMLAAAVMLAWHTIAGTAATAHAGKVLGDRWNLMWAPTRVCIGIAFMTPAFPSGLNLGQELVVTVAAVGSNFATDQWTNFVQNTLVPSQQGGTTSGTGLGIPSPVGGIEVVRQVLRSEVCQQTYAVAPPTGGTMGYVFGQPLRPSAPPTGGVPNGDNSWQVWDYGVCGQVRIPLTASVPSTGLNLGSGSQPDAATTTYVQARVSAISTLISAVRSRNFAQQMAQSQQPGMGYSSTWPQNIVSTLAATGTAYDTAMMNAAGAYVSSERSASYQKLTADAQANGWPAMGAFYRTLAQASATVSDLASEPPTFNAPNVGGWLSYYPGEVAQANIASLDKQWTLESQVPGISGADLAGPGDANSDILTRIIGPASKAVTQAIINLGTTNNADPIQSLMGLGHFLIGAVETAIGTGFVVALATSNGIAAAAGGAAAFTWGSEWARLILSGMLFLGWTHAVVLPMLPFISVIWLFVGWVVLLIEALIAAPIYWLMWVRMDGQELIEGHQKPGLILIFNLLLRPILGVLAFESCYYALPLCMKALNTWFAPTFVGVQGGHFTGLFMALGGLAMLTYLQYQVVVRVSALIHQVPDRVTHWFGASPAGLAEEEHTSRTMAAVIGGSSSGLSHARNASRGFDSKDKNGGGQNSANTPPRQSSHGRSPAPAEARSDASNAPKGAAVEGA